jgi:hypothetical protein
MWEPQPPATLRASTACTGITLPYQNALNLVTIHVGWTSYLAWTIVHYSFFFIWKLGGGVHTGSTRHCGHYLAYCTCPGWLWGWRSWWNEMWLAGETEILGVNLPRRHFVRAAAVGSQRLTASAMARPFITDTSTCSDFWRVASKYVY